jgi:Ca2+-binding EF-hand superfamily protein
VTKSGSAAFIGPAPRANPVEFQPNIFAGSLVGTVLVSVMLLLILSNCFFGVRQYIKYARGVRSSEVHALRQSYEHRAASFAHLQAQQKDPTIPWSMRALHNLRTRWLLGSVLWPVDGDPWLHNQRLFLVLLQVLFAMGFSSLFYVNELETGPRNMTDPNANSSAVLVKSGIPFENGLQASLLTAAIVLPVVGTMSCLFAFVRRPLEADIKAKTGESYERFQKLEQANSETKESTASTESRTFSQKLRAQFSGCRTCCKVQFAHCRIVMCQRRQIAVVEDGPVAQKRDRANTIHLAPEEQTREARLARRKLDERQKTKLQMPRTRSAPSTRRQLCSAQMLATESSVHVLFNTVDHGAKGWITRDELRLLMSELSGGTFISDAALRNVASQLEEPVKDGPALRRAIRGWRYSEIEKSYIVAHWDEIDVDGSGRISVQELHALLTTLNEGVEPSVKELEWVVAHTKTRTLNTDLSVPTLDREELLAAIAVWYPCDSRRRQLKELQQVGRAEAGVRRRAAAAQLDANLVKTNRLLMQHARLLMQQAGGSKSGTLEISGTDMINKAQMDEMRAQNITRSTLKRLMVALVDTACEEDVEQVLIMSDVDKPSDATLQDLGKALAVWITMNDHKEDLLTQFNYFDADDSGDLSRDELKQFLVALNEGGKVSWVEVDWAMASADVDGSGALSRTELLAAVYWWFVHVRRPVIPISSNAVAMLPWALGCVAGLSCVYLVAAVSITSRWDSEMTAEWLQTSLLALAWKFFVIDMMGTLFCGPLFQPLFSLFSCEFGDAFFENMRDAGLEAIEDTIEVYTETPSHSNGSEAMLMGVTEDEVAKMRRSALHGAVFMTGGVGAAMAVKSRRKGALSQAKRKTQQLQEDQNAYAERLQRQKAMSDKRYAEKVAARRRARGRTIGKFARRATAAAAAAAASDGGGGAALQEGDDPAAVEGELPVLGKGAARYWAKEHAAALQAAHAEDHQSVALRMRQLHMDSSAKLVTRIADLHSQSAGEEGSAHTLEEEHEPHGISPGACVVVDSGRLPIREADLPLAPLGHMTGGKRVSHPLHYTVVVSRMPVVCLTCCVQRS